VATKLILTGQLPFSVASSLYLTDTQSAHSTLNESVSFTSPNH